jgi:hypothetical protein
MEQDVASGVWSGDCRRDLERVWRRGERPRPFPKGAAHWPARDRGGGGRMRTPVVATSPVTKEARRGLTHSCAWCPGSWQRRQHDGLGQRQATWSLAKQLKQSPTRSASTFPEHQDGRRLTRRWTRCFFLRLTCCQPSSLGSVDGSSALLLATGRACGAGA